MMNLINTFCEEHKPVDIWTNSPFRGVKELVNDHRGELGESMMSKVFHFLNYEINDDVTNKNAKPDGIYDLKVENQRIEVKTTCAKDNFQHEPLYEADVCDIVIFVDFSYDRYWVSICKREDLPLGKDSKKLFNGRHGSLRKNKDDGWKLDFSFATIKTLVKQGYAHVFDEKSSVEDIANFIDGWWKKNV